MSQVEQASLMLRMTVMVNPSRNVTMNRRQEYLNRYLAPAMKSWQLTDADYLLYWSYHVGA